MAMMGNEIKDRFFQALDKLISAGTVPSVKAFCEKHGIDRRNFMRLKKTDYKLPVEYLGILVAEYGESGNWLLIGK